MKKIIAVPFALVALFALSFCGEKAKVDTSKYEAACAKVAKCDAQMATFPEIDKHCVKMFVDLEKKLPSAVTPTLACINDTACEQLSFIACSQDMAKALDGMIPNLQQ